MTDFIWPSDRNRAYNDELNRVCEELECIMDERDAFKEDYAAQWQRCLELVAERDSWRRVAERLEGEKQALAAHLNTLADKVIEHCSGPRPGTGQMELLREASDILRMAPATSLARLKAEWQAEALESLGHHFMVGDSHKGFILDKAAELRRQAEEKSND